MDIEGKITYVKDDAVKHIHPNPDVEIMLKADGWSLLGAEPTQYKVIEKPKKVKK